MKMTNREACNVSIGLGLTVSICWIDWTERGILHGHGTPEGRPADLRTRPAAIGECEVEALTPDGQAFLELMAEAA